MSRREEIRSIAPAFQRDDGTFDTKALAAAARVQLPMRQRHVEDLDLWEREVKDALRALAPMVVGGEHKHRSYLNETEYRFLVDRQKGRECSARRRATQEVLNAAGAGFDIADQLDRSESFHSFDVEREAPTIRRRRSA